MSYLEDKSFFFESSAPGLRPETFSVVNFRGTEAISRLYEFEITLVSSKADIDIDDMLNHPAVLFLRPERKLPVHGILSSFEQLHEVDGRVFYRATLVPRLWQLTLFNVSEVYLEMTVPDMFKQILKEAKLADKDYELKLTRKYREWSFVCQYQETHFNFISRWMEREGIYYFFEQGEDGEKLIITDTRISHVDLPAEKLVHYSPPSGLETGSQSASLVTAFIRRDKPVPRKVTLQDFNHRKSPPIISGEAVVSEKGRGETMIYGEHMKSNQEAEEYAKLRAQEILCRKSIYHGEGNAAFLRPGWYFEMDRHYRQDMNRKYLLTEIRHEGSQAALLAAGIQGQLSAEEQRPYYRNTIEAIEHDLQFRPDRSTVKPRFHGTINAKVVGESDGKYAELDEYGRYKVKFPFDRSDRAGRRASRWVRMAQPFAGPDEGMHFPLRKNAEVILTFSDGDPDRPMIAAAAPSAEAPSVVNADNSTRNTLRSSGGNVMEFQDEDGKQRILLSSPFMNSHIHIGAPNSPTREIVEYTAGSILEKAKTNTYMEIGDIHTEDIHPDDFNVPENKATERPKDNYKVTKGSSPYKCTAKTSGNLYASVKNDYKMRIMHQEAVEVGDPANTANPVAAGRKTPKSRYGWTVALGPPATEVAPPEVTTMTTTFSDKGISFDWVGAYADEQTDAKGFKYNATNIRQETIHGSHVVEIEGDLNTTVHGTTYGGASGHTVDITQGNTLGITNGNNYEYVKGTVYEYHEGNSYAYTKGDSWEKVEGKQHSIHYGGSIDEYIGVKQEYSLAQAFSVFFGNNDEINILGKGELNLALVLEIFIGVLLDVNLGLKLKTGLAEITVSALKVEDKKLEFKTKQVTIKGHTFNIVNGFELKT